MSDYVRCDFCGLNEPTSNNDGTKFIRSKDGVEPPAHVCLVCVEQMVPILKDEKGSEA